MMRNNMKCPVVAITTTTHEKKNQYSDIFARKRQKKLNY